MEIGGIDQPLTISDTFQVSEGDASKLLALDVRGLKLKRQSSGGAVAQDVIINVGNATDHTAGLSYSAPSMTLTLPTKKTTDQYTFTYTTNVTDPNASNFTIRNEAVYTPGNKAPQTASASTTVALWRWFRTGRHIR